MVVCLERDLCLSYTLHTFTFSMRTNSVLTPCKQGAVLSRYSLGVWLGGKILSRGSKFSFPIPDNRKSREKTSQEKFKIAG